MLVALLEGNRIEAWAAEKGPEYCCPDCRRAVMLKKGRFKVDHFAHYPPVTCSWAKGETKEHMAAKKDFADAFAARGLRVEVEHVLECLKGDRRADVMVWSQNGNGYAVEVQHTSLGIDEVSARTASYHSAGIGVIWVALIKPKLWEDAQRTQSGFFIRRYSPRPWERWAHGYAFKELWFYDPEAKALWKGRLDKHEIYVEASSWYESDGSENSAGGYPRISKRWKELSLEGPFTLDQVQIAPFRRQAASLGKYTYPAGRAARFQCVR